MESQQQGKSDSHVTVARKVTVYLQGISVNPKQVFQSGIQSRIVENTLHEVHADVVRNHRLLEQTAHDKEDALTEHLGRDGQGPADLRNEIAGTHDRSCHQLREERHIESIIQQTGQGFQITPVHVDGIAQRLEGKERNPYRKEYVQRLEPSVPQRSQHFVKEIGVLEIT